MKKLLSLSLMLLMCITLCQARSPKKRLYLTQVFTTDIVCHNCEQKIMNNVAVLGKGVQDVKVNLETKEVTVTYDAAKNNVENLVKGFSKLAVKAAPRDAATQPSAGCCAEEEKAAEKKSCCQEQQGKVEKKSCCSKKSK